MYVAIVTKKIHRNSELKPKLNQVDINRSRGNFCMA